MTSTLPQGPYGFVPLRNHAGGVAPRSEAYYNIASNYGTNIYNGDVVATTGTGRNIEVGTSGDAVRGIFKGCQYVDAQGNTQFQKYWAEGTAVNTNVPILAVVYDDPNTIFKAQTGDGNLANTDMQGFIGFAGQSGGSTSTGISGEYVDVGTVSGSKTTFYLLNLTQVPGNDYSGYTEVEVMIAYHELAPGAFVATGS